MTRFFQSRLSQCLLAFVFSALFALINKEAAFPICIALTAIVLFPKKDIPIIAVMSVLFFFLPLETAFQYSADSLNKVMGSIPKVGIQDSSVLTAVITTAVLFLFITFRKIFYTSFGGKRPLTWALIFSMGLYFSLIYLFRSGFSSGTVTAIAAWSAVAVSKLAWYFCYDMQKRLTGDEPPSWQRAAFYSQFWTFRLITGTIPKGESFWTRFKVKNANELIQLRLQALGLLIWGLILKIVLEKGVPLLSYLLYKAGLRFFTLDQMLVRVQNGQELGSLQAALCALIDNFVRIGYIVFWGHLTVSIIWFCGYKIPKNTDAPHRSSDPLDFFGRMYFYLKEILFQLFYFPCFLYLKNWPLALRVLASLFYATFLGKFLINYTKQVGMILQLGVLGSLHQHASYMIYCLLLTLCLYPFLLKQIRGNTMASHSRLKNFGISFLVFVGYTIIRTYDTLVTGDIWVNTKLLMLMFGFHL